MEWIIENKEWLFGGILISVPLAVIGWIISVRGNKQIQKGGNGSNNIQVGGNLEIGRDKSDD